MDDTLTVPLTGEAVQDRQQSPAVGRTGSYFLQVYSTIRRQITQKRRGPITLFLEVFLPIAFAALLAYLSTLDDLTPFDARQFVSESLPPSNLTTLLRWTVCYRGTDPHLLDTLGPCLTSNVHCNVNGSRSYTHVIPDNVCGANLKYVAPFLRSAVSNFEDDLGLLHFDDFVRMQWAVRIYYGTSSASIFSSQNGLTSLRASGKLIFTPNEPHVHKMVEYLNETYPFVSIWWCLVNLPSQERLCCRTLPPSTMRDRRGASLSPTPIQTNPLNTTLSFPSTGLPSPTQPARATNSTAGSATTLTQGITPPAS